ncbi:PREDICTED: cGMP-dependent 3',5'-cyclic phosphodiesterase-like isoform X2 [Amphimedon queenslandica]|nr:PREDICTED: cGMP-dependent 3',5'-cyclic phosphodiesterase-like isoform X2 [Amphimedon queenslandica]XP_019855663.1 PREDICTED: cGMP-dependent 3',5'-cyclic phosphodiesterase-like isoform X2 [Amphimedon queenslandica]|eukprot:XP_019855662.1 PREDICTED: cGMP-dependent 3',5'-cyclic phosphodiesterase-like isoform X2 [Amphimedon queenslandica]
MDVTPESIEDSIVIVDAISNVGQMRTVALIIAICRQPISDEETDNYHWLSKNVQVAAGRILESIKAEREKKRMEEMLKLSGSLIDVDVPMLLLKLHSHIKEIIGCKRCVVFILDEETDELVCEVFDDVALDSEIRIPIPDCIYGQSIMSDKIIQIDDVSKDPHIKPSKDFVNGYEPSNLLCIPLKSKRTSDGNIAIVGAAVVFDKPDGFTLKSQDDLSYILQFCSTMLVNTLTFRHEIVLKHQNQTLLGVSKNLFTQMNDRDVLLHSIMEEARDLTKAEKCSLFLVDKEKKELSAVVFDSELPDNVSRSSILRIPMGQGIAGYVAQTGESVNIRDVYRNPRFYKEIDKTTGFVTRNLLCIPIMDQTGVVGVAQLVNKKGGRFFTKYDEELAISFSVYCGISLHHAMLYKNVRLEQSRSQLATELMLYHMQVNEEEILSLADAPILPTFSFHIKITDFVFSPRVIPEHDSPTCIISLMEDLDLLNRWKIPRNDLARFVIMVKKGYRNPPYHNWMHAFSVAHFCYSLIKNCPKLRDMLTDLEVLTLFIGCLCHDLDHRGTNNAFQESSNSLLASLYSSQGSVMEHHHFSQTICILNSNGCQIFNNLTSDEYREALDLLYDVILATDICTHLSIVPKLEDLVETGYDKSNQTHHHLLRSLLMTASDLCDCLKEWDMTVCVSELIYQEFFSQGDIEKAIGKTPSVMMDRDKAVLSEQQLTFLDNIAIPVYRLLFQLLPDAEQAYRSVLSNRDKWLEF